MRSMNNNKKIRKIEQRRHLISRKLWTKTFIFLHSEPDVENRQFSKRGLPNRKNDRYPMTVLVENSIRTFIIRLNIILVTV
jgi:hypothetical protein